jgi:membrane fusion protein (multidrug efflux system)
MLKRMLIMVALLVLVTALFIGWKMHAIHAGMAQMAAGFTPPTVSTIEAAKQGWQPQLHSVGSLRAINGADLSAEVAGIVEDIKFDSGVDVEAGVPLVQLRAEDDIAKLQTLQANAKLAEINYDRDTKQLKAQAVSQAAVDTDEATLASAKAQVAEQQAVVDKKTIRAPFAGHLGIRQIDVGQYLNAGTAIVSLQQLDPIYIDFTLPEQALAKLALGQKVTVTNDAIEGKSFNGTILAINSKVDETTRNVSVRATLENPEHKLLPGMFANVSIDVGTPLDFITLPQTAVVYNTYGNTVYLVKKSEEEGKPPLTVQQSVVITGETRGDQVAILSGVKEGDQVVTSGQVKLRNGSPISVNNDIQPANEPSPTPHEQ